MGLKAKIDMYSSMWSACLQNLRSIQSKDNDKENRIKFHPWIWKKKLNEMKKLIRCVISIESRLHQHKNIAHLAPSIERLMVLKEMKFDFFLFVSIFYILFVSLCEFYVGEKWSYQKCLMIGYYPITFSTLILCWWAYFEGENEEDIKYCMWLKVELNRMWIEV